MDLRIRQPTVRREDCVEGGREGKRDEDEDEELEECPAVEESSSEWEPNKLVMGAWKRRRLVVDSIVTVGECVVGVASG
jgi:hypothetical protein